MFEANELIRKFLQKVDEMDGRAAERPDGIVLTTLEKQKRSDAEKAFRELVEHRRNHGC